MIAERAGDAAPSLTVVSKANTNNGAETPSKKNGAAKRPAPEGGKT
jgi:hypothetical protein